MSIVFSKHYSSRKKLYICYSLFSTVEYVQYKSRTVNSIWDCVIVYVFMVMKKHVTQWCILNSFWATMELYGTDSTFKKDIIEGYAGNTLMGVQTGAHTQRRVAHLVKKVVKTYRCVFSSSPYSQPSFSSWMSRVMISPSSKLRSVLLLPDVWGKMVLTRTFFPTLRPDDWDADRDRLSSPRLPWSGRSRGS